MNRSPKSMTASRRPSFTTALLVVLGGVLLLSGFFATPVHAYTSKMAVDVHDFTDDGYTGGSICGACHVASEAGDNRLWARTADNVTYPNFDVRFCMDCHDGTLPATPEWAGATVAPPAISAFHDYASDCATCHPHDKSFRMSNCDCLSCHDEDAGFSYTGNESDEDADILVAKYFGLGNNPGAMGIVSSHNVIYNTSGDLCSPVDNECRKCHGFETSDGVFKDRIHPNIGDELIYYPDDTDSVAAGDPVPNAGAPADFSTYNDFCLACHDGSRKGSDDLHYPATILQIGGASVPAVPARDTSGAAKSAPFFTDGASFGDASNFWMGNGHGRPDGLQGVGTMGLGCLSTPDGSGGSTGCHMSHGGKNYYLLDDSGDKGRGWSGWADIPMTFCLSGTNNANGCHSVAELRETSKHYPTHTRVENQFHTARGDYTMMHVDARYVDLSADFTQPPAANMYWVDNAAYSPTPFMETATAGIFIPALPFFDDADTDLKTGRDWDTPSFDTSPSAITCLTCHDPHGTSQFYEAYEPPIVEHTRGMTRLYSSEWSTGDDFCGQCHLQD